MIAEAQPVPLPVSELMHLIRFDSSAKKVPQAEKQDYFYDQQWFRINALHKNVLFQCLAANVLECYYHRSANNDMLSISHDMWSLDWEERRVLLTLKVYAFG